MAHLIQQMAYVGAEPWHGLGNRLPAKQPLEIWQKEAGMNWQIKESPVRFMADSIGSLGSIHSFPSKKSCTAQTPRKRSPSSRNAIKSSNPVMSWSSTAISPKSPVMSWNGGCPERRQEVLGIGPHRPVNHAKRQ